MQYSNFSLEQLKENSQYETLCNDFFKLAKDQETLEKLQSILYQGGFQQYSVSSKISGKDNPDIEMERRFSMAYLLLKEPETFQFFMDAQIHVFHGTNANALPQILKYGLNSVDTLQEKEIPVSTGERWSRIQGKRGFVSFTDVYDVAEGYSEIPAENGQSYLSFSVILGTTVEDVKKNKIIHVKSDVPEICVENSFPLESIRFIGVPENQVEFVKSMMPNNQISVLAIPNPEDKFYYVSDMSEVYFYPDKYEAFQKEQENHQEKIFTKKEVETLAKSRGLSHMKKFIKKMKDTLFEGGEKEVGRVIR